MNFVRAFEFYERRWGIEVIFKECRGYLGLGKCQSRSYNAQIADTTLCFMMYQMLSLAKRFSEYETLGALFRSERDRLQVLTLWSRTLEEVRHLLEVLSREAGSVIVGMPINCSCTANGILLHKVLGTSSMRFGRLCHARLGLNIF